MRFIGLAGLLGGCLAAVVAGNAVVGQGTETAPPRPTTLTPQTAAAFDVVLSTVRHPRCMNCHTSTEFPRQNDERRRHPMGVMRGADNQGLPGLRCSSCHTETNNDLAGVPGAPHWGLAPLSMAWEYLSDAEICEQLQDLERNGGKTLAELHEHMVADPLVLWAWEPGLHPAGEPRSVPPYTVAELDAAMKTWIEAGAPCPSTEDRP